MAEIQLQDTAPAEPVDQAAFRQTMGLFATGVCVVSRMNDDGTPSGMTANSLVSVSLDPMLISWSIQNTSSQFAAYSEAQEFAISILSEGQHELALRYASRGDSQTLPSDFEWTSRGLPVVAGAVAHLECRHWSAYPAGDHTMIFGEVLSLMPRADVAPLAFFGGQFRGISDQP